MRSRAADRNAYALAGLRIFTGVLWLANLAWKLPPDFGGEDPEGMMYSYQLAEQHAVLGFLRDFVGDVVIPNFTLFTSLVFAVELVAGVLLTAGVWTRIGALFGTVQAIAITLLVVQAPSEWFWTYAMLIVLNVVCLVADTDERLSLRPVLRRMGVGGGGR